MTKAYACKNKDQNDRQNSTSGGFFMALARYVIQLGGTVYGVMLNEDNNAVHIRVSDATDLHLLQGSKYIQSSMNKTFIQVLEDLTNGKWVLFTGTPCQTRALCDYLKRPFDKLIMADVVCFGVMKQSIWMKYIQQLESKNQSSVRRYEFRNKSQGWDNSIVRIEYANGTIDTEKIDDSLFSKIYYAGLALEDRCYTCTHKGFVSPSDFQLGDYWGIKRYYPDFYDENGVSLVFVKTDKAEEIFTRISDSVEYIETTVDQAVHNNPHVLYNVSPNSDRRIFLSNAECMDLNEAYTSVCNAARLKITGSYTFEVWGSHNIRASVRTMIKDSSCRLEHISKSSIISAMSDKSDISFNRKTSNISNKYWEEMVSYDLNKSWQRDVRNPGDFFIFDLLEERYNIIDVNKTYITKSDAFDRIYEAGANVQIEFTNHKNYELWLTYIDSFIDIVLSRYDNKVIMIKTYMSTQYGNEYSRDNYKSDNDIELVNRELSKRYEYIERKYPMIRALNYNKDHIYTDEDHLYGCYPYHLNDKAYHDMAIQIYSTLEGESL